MFLALYLTNTWSGEIAFRVCCEALKKVDSNMQHVKQLFGITAVLVGMLRLRLLPNQEALDGAASRLHRGIGVAHWNLEEV